MSYFTERVNYPVHAIKVNFTVHAHNLKHHSGCDTKMSPTNYESLNALRHHAHVVSVVRTYRQRIDNLMDASSKRNR